MTPERRKPLRAFGPPRVAENGRNAFRMMRSGGQPCGRANRFKPDASLQHEARPPKLRFPSPNAKSQPPCLTSTRGTALQISLSRHKREISAPLPRSNTRHDPKNFASAVPARFECPRLPTVRRPPAGRPAIRQAGAAARAAGHGLAAGAAEYPRRARGVRELCGGAGLRGRQPDTLRRPGPARPTPGTRGARRARHPRPSTRRRADAVAVRHVCPRPGRLRSRYSTTMWRQLLSQPSPSMRLPSSQSSPICRTPSPQ